MKTRSKKQPKIRRELLLGTAIKLSLKIGYQHITRDGVAKAANVSTGLINQYFGTIKKLRKEVLKTAIKREVIEIIAQGFGSRDSLVLKISSDLKQKAIMYLSNF